MEARSRVRKRPVSFGNPALGTYKGCVYTIEPLLSTIDSSKSGPDAGKTLPIVEGLEAVERMVAMLDVPPEQVPEGILNLARYHKPSIEHVRIVIADIPEENGIRDDNEENSTFPDENEQAVEESKEEGETLREMMGVSSDSQELDFAWPDNEDRPSRTYLILFHMNSEEEAQTFVNDLNGKPYTSLDETVTCSIETVVALQGEGGVSLLNPMFAPSTNTSHGGLQILSSSSSVGDDVDKKGTGRNPNGAASTATSGSCHNSNQMAEDTNCPVCLDHLSFESTSEDKTAILTTVCNHTFHLGCLIKCQDSPCPVCRYDHAGLNEALSQCHICGTTERNYVCLICGAVSCVSSMRAAHAAPPAAAGDGHTPQASAEDAQHFYTSHAGQHYNDTLHAYALDTETQHVWDFAGQGYVHRLLQNKEDGKLVESNDPNNTTSQERSLAPGLSDTQEGEVVHRKLEGFASQYYTLLKSQLEQQRIFYEGRLEEMRREFAMKQMNTVNEQADLISALRQERKQLTQRLMALKRKKDKAIEDVGFLRSMNESLEANKAPLERKIQQVQREQVESREMFQKYLPALEEKVTTLMLQLEESMNANNTADAAVD